jgi:hypothetical protein
MEPATGHEGARAPNVDDAVEQVCPRQLAREDLPHAASSSRCY